MQFRLLLFLAACLFSLLASAAGANILAATNGVVIGASHPAVVIHKPALQLPQVVIEHKPPTLVPVATIPSFSITDKLGDLWNGISDSISTKIKAVGDFLRGPPKVVLINTTQKPTHKPPVIQIVGVPHYPVHVPVVVGGCGNRIKCNTY